MNKYLVVDIILISLILLVTLCNIRVSKQNEAKRYSELVEYTIKKGENLHTITKNNDYIIEVIYENNLDYFDGVNHTIDNINPGDKIKVPVYD